MVAEENNKQNCKLCWVVMSIELLQLLFQLLHKLMDDRVYTTQKFCSIKVKNKWVATVHSFLYALDGCDQNTHNILTKDLIWIPLPMLKCTTSHKYFLKNTLLDRLYNPKAMHMYKDMHKYVYPSRQTTLLAWPSS